MKLKSDVITRAAMSADLADIATVFLRARRELMPFAPLAHTDHAVYRWIRDWLIPTGRATVAIDAQGLVVGLAATSEAHGVLWLDHLYVLPPTIGQGIGTILLRQVLADARSPVHLHCFAENARARAFYERHGFVAIAFGDGSDNDEGCPDVVYAWQPGSGRDA
jgi:GNAT superfamily N-acetyltransferase